MVSPVLGRIQAVAGVAGEEDRSPTTIGLDVPGPGSFVCQTMFFLADQVGGQPLLVADALPAGTAETASSRHQAERGKKNKCDRSTPKLLSHAGEAHAGTR